MRKLLKIEYCNKKFIVSKLIMDGEAHETTLIVIKPMSPSRLEFKSLTKPSDNDILTGDNIGVESKIIEFDKEDEMLIDAYGHNIQIYIGPLDGHRRIYVLQGIKTAEFYNAKKIVLTDEDGTWFEY